MDLLLAILKWLGGAFIALLAWLGVDVWKRVRELEKDRAQMVTRDHLDEVRSSITSSFQNSHERIENKLDRLIERNLK